MSHHPFLTGVQPAGTSPSTRERAYSSSTTVTTSLHSLDTDFFQLAVDSSVQGARVRSSLLPPWTVLSLCKTCLWLCPCRWEGDYSKAAGDTAAAAVPYQASHSFFFFHPSPIFSVRNLPGSSKTPRLPAGQCFCGVGGSRACLPQRLRLPRLPTADGACSLSAVLPQRQHPNTSPVTSTLGFPVYTLLQDASVL